MAHPLHLEFEVYRLLAKSPIPVARPLWYEDEPERLLPGFGSSFIPVTNGFTAWFGPLRHDGAETYRIEAYVNG